MRVVSRRRRRFRRGTSAVELAVLLPFLVLVFVVGADWCRIYYAAHTVDECARSGALAASGIAFQEHDLTDAERESRAVAQVLEDADHVSPAIQATDVTVVTDADYVTVTVDYDFSTIASFVSGAWPLTRTVRMPIQP